MDDSWRMRMPTFSPQRSTDHSFYRSDYSGAATFDADDFSDVFGGPPRSVLSPHISGGFGLKQSDVFYEEVFRSPECVSQAINSGRSLPAFRIPAKEEAFYSDIFGSKCEKLSRERSGKNSKAKSNSSSVLSSEEFSPLRSMGDDVAFPAFASKLRPIHVQCGWNSNHKIPEEPRKKQERPAFRRNCSENQFAGYDFMERFRSPNYEFSRHASSPETISLERPNSSHQSNLVSADDSEVNSISSSVASSLCQVPEDKAAIQGSGLPEEDEDEVMSSSYVIEINSDYQEESREREAVDDAIAWAKQMFQRQTSETNLSSKSPEKNKQCVEVEGSCNSSENPDQQLNENRTRQVSEEEQQTSSTGEEKEAELENEKLIKTLEEDIKLWSAGKETNIRLLISTLHHILWPKSGWHPISVTSLIGTSQVKKAYQKARLCLHPDKMQQRGATEPQKHVAEKAFSILQDAWAAFISQDVF